MYTRLKELTYDIVLWQQKGPTLREHLLFPQRFERRRLEQSNH